MSSREEGLHIPSRRKIDTWVHKIRIGPDWKEYKIAISIVKQNNGEMSFEAFSRDWGYPHDAMSADINNLRRQVEQRIRAMDLGDGLEWSDYFKIEAEGNSNSYFGNPEESKSQHLKVSCERTRCARLPDGELYYLDGQNNPRKAISRTGQKNDMLRGKPIDAHESVSFIPATPENEAALQDILGKMRLLRVRLTELLAQEQIFESLQRISAGAQLLIEEKPSEKSRTTCKPR